MVRIPIGHFLCMCPGSNPADQKGQLLGVEASESYLIEPGFVWAGSEAPGLQEALEVFAFPAELGNWW